MRLHTLLPLVGALTLGLPAAPRAQELLYQGVASPLPAPTTSSARLAAYGRSVAALGSSWVVGAPGARLSAGMAQLRQGGTFALEPPVVAPPGARFGEAVVAAGTLAIVGAPGWDELDGVYGMVHIFSVEAAAMGGSPWLGVVALSTIEPGDQIGHTLAISGTTLAVLGRATGSGPSHIYLYELNPLTGEASHTATIALPAAAGTLPARPQLAISDQWVAVSLERAGAGEVVLFERNAQRDWERSPAATLTSTLGNATFGAQLAADPTRSDRLAVSAPATSDAGGAIELFVRGADTVWASDELVRPAAGYGHLGELMAWSDTLLVATEREDALPIPSVAALTVGQPGSASQRVPRWEVPAATLTLEGGALSASGANVLLGAPSDGEGGVVHAAERLPGGAWFDWDEDTSYTEAFTGQGDLPDLGAGVAAVRGRLLVGAPTGAQAGASASRNGLITLYDAVNGAWTPGAQIAPPAALKGWGEAILATANSAQALVRGRALDDSPRVSLLDLSGPAPNERQVLDVGDLPFVLAGEGLALAGSWALVSAQDASGHPSLCVYRHDPTLVGEDQVQLQGCQSMSEAMAGEVIDAIVMTRDLGADVDVAVRTRSGKLATLVLGGDGVLTLRGLFADGDALPSQLAYDGRWLFATVPQTGQLLVFDASAGSKDAAQPPVLRAGGVAGQRWDGSLVTVRQGSASWLIGEVRADSGEAAVFSLALQDLTASALGSKLLAGRDATTSLGALPAVRGDAARRLTWLGEEGLLVQRGYQLDVWPVRVPLTLELVQVPTLTNLRQPEVIVRALPTRDGVSVEAASTTPAPTPWTGAQSGAVWTFQPDTPLPDGAHQVTITSQRAGEAASQRTVSFEVDATAPDLTIIAPPEGVEVLRRNPPPIGGLSEPGATITATVSGTTDAGDAIPARELIVRRRADGAGWLAALAGPVPAGAYTLTVQSTDAAGNRATLTREARVPAPSPRVDVAGLAPDVKLPARPALSGEAAAGSLVAVTLDALAPEEVVSGEEDLWDYTPDAPLAAGAHQLTIEITPPDGEKLPPRTFLFTVNASDADAPLSSSRCTLMPLDVPQRAPQPWVWIVLGVVVCSWRSSRRLSL